MRILGPGESFVMQPWNQVLFPAADATPYGVETVRAIPGVAKALAVIAGVMRQMPLDDVKLGEVVSPRPTVLEKPDPDMSRSRFLGVMTEDYLLHGNAIAAVTSRDATGWPATLGYIPAQHCVVEWDHDNRQLGYRVGDRVFRPADVVHIPRGSDPWFPWRGMGVVEQHTDTLSRAREESQYSRQILSGSGVPSVVIVSPNKDLSQEEADAAKSSWLEKYGGPTRQPAILPFGTEVKPLSWSPTDAQLVEARGLTRNDIADMFGLDSYWLGGEMKGLTYRSPGPLFLNLLRVTVEPIVQDFEQPLSDALLPHLHGVRFDRSAVLRDDLATEVATLNAAVETGLLTWEEARQRLGKSADPALKPKPKPAPVPVPAAPVAEEITP